MSLTHCKSKKCYHVFTWATCVYSSAYVQLLCSLCFLFLLIGNFDPNIFGSEASKVWGPCLAEHVRTFLNPALVFCDHYNCFHHNYYCHNYFILLPCIITGLSGLARLPAARQIPGSNRAANRSSCFHESHCDTQLCAWAAHWLQCLGRLSLPPSEGR